MYCMDFKDIIRVLLMLSVLRSCFIWLLYGVICIPCTHEALSSILRNIPASITILFDGFV